MLLVAVLEVVVVVVSVVAVAFVVAAWSLRDSTSSSRGECSSSARGGVLSSVSLLNDRPQRPPRHNSAQLIEQETKAKHIETVARTGQPDELNKETTQTSQTKKEHI